MVSFFSGILGIFCLVFGIACLVGGLVCIGIFLWMIWPITLVVVAILSPAIATNFIRGFRMRREMKELFRLEDQRAAVRDELTERAILRGDADPWPQTGTALDP